MSRIKTLIIALILIISGSSMSNALTQEEAIEEAHGTIMKAANSVWDEKWNLTKKYGEELIEKYPNAYPGYLFLGIALDEKGKHKKAIEYYQKALELTKNDTKYHASIFQNMGYAYLHMKDYPNAIKYYKKALELDQDNKHAKTQLKQVYAVYKVGSIREVPITKIDENHFKIKKEDIVRSFYFRIGQSLVGKEVAAPIEKELIAKIKEITSRKYVSANKSVIKEDIYFEGTSWDDATGSWTEHWEFFIINDNPRIVPIKFSYEKGKITGNYNIGEMYERYVVRYIEE